MKVLSINYKTPIKVQEGLALCLGYFDGIHLGHQALIKHGTMNRIQDGEDNLSVGVLTFDNPVSKFVDNGKVKGILTTVEDRKLKISKLPFVDYLCVVHVDHNFCELSPEAFIEMLKKMNVKQVFCGSDYKFGKDAKGDVSLLEKHFVVNVLDTDEPFKEKISTHTIVEHIQNGEIEKANKQLGYHYAIIGNVVKGKKKGRDIGFPTLNIKPEANYILPKFGVYRSRVVLGIREYVGLTNVGMRPTLGYEGEAPGIETHLVDAKVDDLYGERVTITFEEFIRDEIKFESIDELKAQIQKDLAKVRQANEASGPVKYQPDSRALNLFDNLEKLVLDFGYDRAVVDKVMGESILTVRGFLARQEALSKVLTPEEFGELQNFILTKLMK